MKENVLLLLNEIPLDETNLSTLCFHPPDSFLHLPHVLVQGGGARGAVLAAVEIRSRHDLHVWLGRVAGDLGVHLGGDVHKNTQVTVVSVLKTHISKSAEFLRNINMVQCLMWSHLRGYQVLLPREGAGETQCQVVCLAAGVCEVTNIEWVRQALHQLVHVFLKHLRHEALGGHQLAHLLLPRLHHLRTAPAVSKGWIIKLYIFVESCYCGSVSAPH